MNYVFTKAIILFILLLIYLICQPKTLFEGMNSSSLKNKTVQSSDIEDGKNPNFNVGDTSWYNIDNPNNVLYSSCETAASGENLDVSMCSFNSNLMNENDTSDDNSNANNSSGNNSKANNSSGNNSIGNKSNEKN